MFIAHSSYNIFQKLTHTEKEAVKMHKELIYWWYEMTQSEHYSQSLKSPPLLVSVQKILICYLAICTCLWPFQFFEEIIKSQFS